jgi:hypothetical protein
MVNTLQTCSYGIPKTSIELGKSIPHVKMRPRTAKPQVHESACPREHKSEWDRGMLSTLKTRLYGIPMTSSDLGQSIFHVEMHARPAKLQVCESACPREHKSECERGIVGTLQTCSYSIYNNVNVHGQSIFYPKMRLGASTQRMPALKNTSQNETGAW